MRILYIDIDSLRPDHLGCYGYHRNTSPNIDQIAANATRFNHCYVTDAPCLPSRSALWSGRCGYHNGVVGHGGTAGQPFIEGASRNFKDTFGQTSWMAALRQAGYKTATISSFGERHSAWHWYAGYSEITNPGYSGHDRADQVTPIALDWLKRNGEADNWFLHLNFWDPHTPYRTPLEYGYPFAGESLSVWLTDELRESLYEGFGPHSAQDTHSWGWEADQFVSRFPRLPRSLDSMDTMRQWIDGYDTGIHYADHHIGQVMNALADAGVLDETIIMISADHGENQGELNVWGDHQTADAITCRVPLIVYWPGLTDTPREDNSLIYQYDFAATMIELVGGTVPDNWDGQAFTASFKTGQEAGRDYLVTSQNVWACQRGIRFNAEGKDCICLRTHHDGLKNLEPVMLFNLTDDPHEQNNLAQERPDLVNIAMRHLADWQQDMQLTSTTNQDPMMTVLREGGPFHTRNMLPRYAAHLRETGRTQHAERLEAWHPDEL